jgi:hypothetical protein
MRVTFLDLRLSDKKIGRLLTSLGFGDVTWCTTVRRGGVVTRITASFEGDVTTTTDGRVLLAGKYVKVSIGGPDKEKMGKKKKAAPKRVRPEKDMSELADAEANAYFEEADLMRYQDELDLFMFHNDRACFYGYGYY